MWRSMTTATARPLSAGRHLVSDAEPQYRRMAVKAWRGEERRILVLDQRLLVGAGYVQLALELGVEPSRIDTIVNFEAVARYGVNAEGYAAASTASVLAELAGLIAAGELELPIAATFPLVRVQDAYRRLAEDHVLGKIVLLP
jgi:hypothetical protein